MGEAQTAARNPAQDLAGIAAAKGRGGPLWLRRLRKEALVRFETLGLPTLKDEEWRNTPIAAPIARTPFGAPAAAEIGLKNLEGIDLALWAEHRVVTVNGRFSRELSSIEGLPAGLRVGGLEEALATHPEQVEPHLARLAPFGDRPFVALNTAAIADGVVAFVPDRTALDHPLHVLHLTVACGEPTLVHPRTLVVVGAECLVTMVETYLGLGDVPALTNAVTEIAVGPNSRVSHVRIERDRSGTFHVGATQARQGRDSRLVSTVVSLGSDLTRLDTGSILAGEGANCLLNGLYLADGARLVDNHTTLDHAVPHCGSYESYKGLLTGRSRAIFNGRIIVRQDAQKTDAKQSNRNLILSDEATAFTRPQLEIYANDVRCTHGATIGRLDENALFYLRSRGLPLEEARATLIRAFAGEILGQIGVGPVAAALEREVLALLPRGRR